MTRMACGSSEPRKSPWNTSRRACSSFRWKCHFSQAPNISTVRCLRKRLSMRICSALVAHTHSLTSEIQHSPPASSTFRSASSLLNVFSRQKISPTTPMSGRRTEKSAGAWFRRALPDRRVRGPLHLFVRPYPEQKLLEQVARHQRAPCGAQQLVRMLSHAGVPVLAGGRQQEHVAVPHLTENHFHERAVLPEAAGTAGSRHKKGPPPGGNVPWYQRRR